MAPLAQALRGDRGLCHAPSYLGALLVGEHLGELEELDSALNAKLLILGEVHLANPTLSEHTQELIAGVVEVAPPLQAHVGVDVEVKRAALPLDVSRGAGRRSEQRDRLKRAVVLKHN